MIPLRRSQRSQGVFCEEETRRALLISAQEAGVQPDLSRMRTSGMKCFKRRKRGEPVEPVQCDLMAGGDCELRNEENSNREAGNTKDVWPAGHTELVDDVAGEMTSSQKPKITRERSLTDLLKITKDVNASGSATKRLQDAKAATNEESDSDGNVENEVVTPKPRRTLQRRRSASRSGRRKRKKKDVIRTHFGIPEESSQDPAPEGANEEYLLVDVDESPDASEKIKNRERVRYAYPSCDDPDAVEVNHSDVRCLEENEYINDTVVDLYIKFVQRSLPRPQDAIHVFNSFFYKKLAEAVVDKTLEKLDKLRKWMKGVSIFDKSYLVMPIHDRLHWSLAIICFSGDRPGCYILHLDSMKTGHKSSVVYEVVRRYLLAEWKSQGGATSDAKKFHVKKVKVPQQDNEYDCGLYMLHFIQSFLTNAPSTFSNDLPNNMYDWFSSVEASNLRESIRNILVGFLDAKKQENTDIMENPNQAQVPKSLTLQDCEDKESEAQGATDQSRVNDGERDNVTSS